MSYSTPRDWYNYPINLYLLEDAKKINRRERASLYSAYIRNKSYTIKRSESGNFYNKRRLKYVRSGKYYKKEWRHSKLRVGGLVSILCL